jgi:hypothetical protein
MVNNNFKHILQEWNKYLLKEEDAGRVMSMIDDLESYGEKIYIKEITKDSIVITYGPEYRSNNKLHGSIKCSNTAWQYKNAPGHNEGIGAGEQNSCWEVNLTSRTTRGMGPLLYEVLIEYISSVKQASLKPDARSVSQFARSVWNKFDARPDDDIKKIQLDVNEKTIQDTTMYDKESSETVKQLTPDNVKDDTVQYSAIGDKGRKNWHQSALSRSYKKTSTPLIEELKKRNLIVLPKVFKSKLGGAWS